MGQVQIGVKTGKGIQGGAGLYSGSIVANGTLAGVTVGSALAAVRGLTAEQSSTTVTWARSRSAAVSWGRGALFLETWAASAATWRV